MTARAKRILVVDDEEDVQVLVCRILRDAGYDVDSASEGGEAIQKMAAHPPDLVVLDLMMPGIDGWGVFEHLRWIRNPPPVVVMTAYTDFGTFARGVREGAAAYVCKPFRFHELVATCQRVMLQVAERAFPGVERRRESRRLLMVEVKVLSRDRAPIALGELVNLSLGGARVELGVPLERGDSVRIAFHIPGASAASLALEGCVQWRTPAPRGFAHGLSFVALSRDEERQLGDLLRPWA